MSHGIRLVLIALMISNSAFASESTIDPPATEGLAWDDSGDRLRKFELALRTLGVPSESAPTYDDFPDDFTVSTAAVNAIAKYIDPQGGLRRYLQLQPSRIDLFRDFFSNPAAYVEYTLATGAPENSDSAELVGRLERIADQVRSGGIHPLAGFRVLLDAGHMSTPFWDKETGKFVRVGGKTVSEGELNIWTVMRVAQELESLGAEVRLSRTGDGPVTPYRYDNFDPREQTAAYYYRSLDNWMPKYLAMSDSELTRNLPRAPEVTRLRGVGRGDLFLQEDLNARMKIHSEFRPDLFMAFHFDAMSTSKLQKSHNDVEIYIPGAVGKTETGGRNDRALVTKHLLEVRRWQQSAKIAGHLVRNVAKGLNLPLLTGDRSPKMYRVADGVYSRNLFQTKRADSGLCVFFESLHYDHQSEFARLTKRDRTATFRGRRFDYPSRLDSIANGVREGMLAYFRELP